MWHFVIYVSENEFNFFALSLSFFCFQTKCWFIHSRKKNTLLFLYCMLCCFFFTMKSYLLSEQLSLLITMKIQHKYSRTWFWFNQIKEFSFCFLFTTTMKSDNLILNVRIQKNSTSIFVIVFFSINIRLFPLFVLSLSPSYLATQTYSKLDKAQI